MDVLKGGTPWMREGHYLCDSMCLLLPDQSHCVLQILEGVVAEGPESDRVLSIMAYAYKDADRCSVRVKPECLHAAH